MQLLLIRHGLPQKVVTQDGSPADPPLSKQGHAQASSMAEWLAREGVDRVYASPLRRAHQTALPLAELLGLDIALEPRIAEYDRDSDLYIPLEELKQTDYRAWKAFMEQGYPAGLDLDRFCGDVVNAMESIIAENRGRRVAVVCHGGVINTWAAHVLGMQYQLFCDVQYTSISRFLATTSGVRSIASLNEAAHLREL